MTHCKFTDPHALAMYTEYCDNVQIDSKYLAIHDGQIVSIINPRLAVTRNLTDDTLKTIVDLHVARYNTCKSAETIVDLSDPANVKRLYQLYDTYMEVERCLQINWGFPEDYTYYAWYDFPHCTCPKMDNDERKGTAYQIIDGDCPIHGTRLSIV